METFTHLSISCWPVTFVMAAIYLIIILEASVFPEPLSPIRTEEYVHLDDLGLAKLPEKETEVGRQVEAEMAKARRGENRVSTTCKQIVNTNKCRELETEALDWIMGFNLKNS